MINQNKRRFLKWAAGTAAAGTGIAGLAYFATRETGLSDFEKAVENYRLRNDYVPEKFASKKPENVEYIIYDHSRTGATNAARRYAMLTADHYYQNFDNPEAMQEVKELLKDDTITFSSNNDKLNLRDRIEKYLKSDLFQKIKSSSAITIEIPHEYGKTPRYNLFIFPEAFVSKPGEIRQTENGLNAIVEVQYFVAQGKYKLPMMR